MLYTFVRYGFIFLILFTSQLHAERFDHDEPDTRPSVCWKKESEGVKNGELCKFYMGRKHYLGVVKIENNRPMCDRVFEGNRLHSLEFEMLYGINYKVLEDEFQSRKEEAFIAQYPPCFPSDWDRPMPRATLTDDPTDPHKVCLTPDEYDGHQIGLQDSAAVCHRLGGKIYSDVAEPVQPKKCVERCSWVSRGCAWAWQTGKGPSNYGHQLMDACQNLAISLGYKFASNDGISCGAGDYLNYDDRAKGSNYATEHVCNKVCTRQ